MPSEALKAQIPDDGPNNSDIAWLKNMQVGAHYSTTDSTNMMTGTEAHAHASRRVPNAEQVYQ